MIKTFAIGIAAAFAASPAFAHTGHIAEAEGHAHWIAIGACAAAAVLLVVLLRDELLQRRKKNAELAKRKNRART